MNRMNWPVILASLFVGGVLWLTGTPAHIAVIVAALLAIGGTWGLR